MISKVTLTYSDGSTHDFLSIDDAAAMAATPELHPDVGVTQNAPVEAAPAMEAPAAEENVAAEGDVTPPLE